MRGTKTVRTISAAAVTANVASGRINAYLVCGGRYHDMDFARLELLKLLHEHAQIRVRVGDDYRNTPAIGTSDLLVTYTCDVVPAEPEQAVACST